MQGLETELSDLALRPGPLARLSSFRYEARPDPVRDPRSDLLDPGPDGPDPAAPHLHVLHQPVDIAGEIAVQPVRVTKE